MDVLYTVLKNSDINIVKPYISIYIYIYNKIAEIVTPLLTILQKDEMNRVNAINLLTVIVNNFSSILPSPQVSILLDVVIKAISSKNDIYTTLQNLKLMTSMIENGLVSDYEKLKAGVFDQILIISKNTTITVYILYFIYLID